MNEQYQRSASSQELASGSKKPIAKPAPAKARVRRKRKGYQPRAHNAFYALAAEFKRRHPDATAVDAWKHFISLADLDAVLVSHNGETDVLTYTPDVDRFGTREIKRDSFTRQYRNLAEV